MEIPATFAIAGLTSILYCIFFWSASLRYKKTWLTDIAWSSGFFVVYLVVLLINANFSFKQNLILLMLFLWGFRLTFYLVVRNLNKNQEFEYQKLKEKWGKRILSGTPLLVSLWQALGLFLVSAPAILVSTYKEVTQIGFYDILFSGLWLAGFFLESFADLELYKFKKNPANQGRILKEGLWKYSRHPNYFGEILMWLAIFFLILPVPNAVFTIVSPIFLVVSLLRFTGVKVIEKRFQYDLEYTSYANSTNKILPIPRTNTQNTENIV